MTTQFQFPADFIWGASTSAYQIEGAPLEDGAGPSIWQRFAHTPGMIANGENGDIACDHYHRYKDDVQLMKKLGLKAYRFSISWSRVLPNGVGEINQAGLNFYCNLVDELLANDIVPLVTLFHWDLPAALDDRGGWLNPEIAEWFSHYATTMFRALDGKVKSWATFNEPWVVSDGGYLHGKLAPGHRSAYEAAIAAHHMLKAHGSAVKAYRAIGKHQIGIVVNLEPKYPVSAAPEDIAAAKRAHAYMNGQYLDPIFLGRYPERMKEVFGQAWPQWPAEDMALISQKIDFIGINYYTRSVTKNDPSAWPVQASPVKQSQAIYTETNWEVYPQAFTDVLLWVKNRYNNPIVYITENGAAFYDPPTADQGKVNDPLRMNYLHKHISAVRDAMEAGANIQGYCVWSLFDNLEWSLGFAKRFGIIHVNFETQERTFKDSAMYYKKVIISNGEILRSTPYIKQENKALAMINEDGDK